MNGVSAAIRLICGLALIILAYSSYGRASAHVANGEPVQIFGITIGASPSEFKLSLIVVALIGVFMIVLGVVTLA
jgi:hypothetical protein